MAFTIKLDRGPLAQVAKDLRNAEAVIAKAEYRAINKVTNKAMTSSRREIISRVNLTQAYVRERMSVQPATQGRPVAYISARVRGTRLATYGARQVMRSAPKARGDKRRSIPAGKKQAGITVSVKRGSGRKKMPGAFFMPLRAGKVAGGNGMGVFWRYGKEIEQLYGPSVDQVFKGVIPDIEPEIQADLNKTAADQLEYEIRKALKTR